MTPSLETAELLHGGRLGEARRRFPGAPEPFLDLSTGINPAPYSLPALDPDAWTRLPEPEALDALQCAAALAYGVSDPDMVVAAPGTQILISLMPHLLGQASAAVLGPTYGEHRAAWHNAGRSTQEVTRLDDLAAAPAGVLCNPNNPDGQRHQPADLLKLADRFAAKRGVLIVDEAFVDTDPALSLAAALPHPALILLRSFGKFYGLAGLRLGFALCEPERARLLRRALGPWAVSGPAAYVGTQALNDHAWQDRSRAALAQSADRLDAMLSSAGLCVRGGTNLFRLAEPPNAPSLFERLGRAGMLVRRFDSHLNWLRFGLPADQSAWDRLDNALRT